jgi:hypothetical protein
MLYCPADSGEQAIYILKKYLKNSLLSKKAKSISRDSPFKLPGLKLKTTLNFNLIYSISSRVPVHVLVRITTFPEVLL